MKKLLLTVLLFLLAASAWAGDIRALVQKAKPAVVQIGAFDQAGQLLSTGTAFFITADGYVLTNRHMIEGAAKILARDYKGTVYHLKRIVAVSQETDIAELQFDVSGQVPFLTLGSTSNVVEGERVLVIGNPEELTFTVSDGIISAFRENRSIIQITAPISHGSSGSPVLDAESGQVIGIATWIFKEGQNLNLCISAETIQSAIAKVEEAPAPVAAATPTPNSLDKYFLDSPPPPSSDAKQLADDYFTRGFREWAHKNYSKSVTYFDGAIALQYHDSARAYALRADAYYHLKQYGQAISDYTEAIKLCPGSDFSYEGRSKVYEKLGKSHEATQDRIRAFGLRNDLGRNK